MTWGQRLSVHILRFLGIKTKRISSARVVTLSVNTARGVQLSRLVDGDNVGSLYHLHDGDEKVTLEHRDLDTLIHACTIMQEQYPEGETDG